MPAILPSSDPIIAQRDFTANRHAMTRDRSGEIDVSALNA
jgi:hypothetical protein